MCCGFWEIKVFSLLQKLEEEILTFLVDGGVLGSDAWKCCPNSAATHKEGHCRGGGVVIVSLILTLWKAERRERGATYLVSAPGSSHT